MPTVSPLSQDSVLAAAPTRKLSDNPRFVPIFTGIAGFLALQYLLALWNLSLSSGAMANKFSTLAREEHLGFLIRQNLLMLVAYGLLALAGTFFARPLLALLPDRWLGTSFLRQGVVGFFAAALLHGFFLLRLAKTRPYFLNEAAFGQWYYQMLDSLPLALQPSLFFLLFSLLPLAVLIYATSWHLRPLGNKPRMALALILPISGGLFWWISSDSSATPTPAPSAATQPNFLIIASDSLRADRLGCYGYRPARADTPTAALGVSPHIDALAARSTRFDRCFTAIASTMESGTQLIASQYPHTHGLRHMYPDRQTIEATRKKIVPFPTQLRSHGYESIAIGDWCAGYNEIVPLDFDRLSVSSFDTFQIYMSQAVVMAHFVVPLYFDHPLGYRIFPQLESFAQFVTPKVVTDRVEALLSDAARSKKPFFHHVFYSCNHLPYRSNEPYVSLFADPAYRGKNRNGVDFDIDAFIGGTDLESKWKALPPHEVAQIRALYDGCTRQFDDCVARILATLQRTGLDRNTIVIITSDHGDDLYEPGVTLGHGLTFNGGLHANHVPMIVHVPGLPPKTIPETVRMIDIIPTLADFAGITQPAQWEGKSFAGWLTGRDTPAHRPFFGETGFPFIQFGVPGVTRPKLPPMDEMTFIDSTFNYQFVLKPDYQDRLVQAKQCCLRTRDWKLVSTPTTAGTRHFGLFHLASDPDALRDLAATRPEVLAPMKQALESWIDHRQESSIEQIFPAGEPQ